MPLCPVVNCIHGFDIKYVYDCNTIYDMQEINLYNSIRSIRIV